MILQELLLQDQRSVSTEFLRRYILIWRLSKIFIIILLCFSVGIETEKKHEPFAYWQVGDSARYYDYPTEVSKYVSIGCGWPFVETVSRSDEEWSCGTFPPFSGFGFVKVRTSGCFKREDLASREVDLIYLCGSRGDL